MFIYIYRLIFRNKKPKTNYNININNCDNVIDSINIDGNNCQLSNYIYIDGELHRFPTKINVDGTTYKVINNKKGIKKMNKRECINFIKTEIEKCEKEFMDDWKATGSSKQQIKINAYINCKKICAENGYVDKTFEDLWNKAVFELRYIKK